MRILVTGGAGFVGSNLVYHLLALEGEVLVVDDLSTGSADHLDPRADFRCLDVRAGEFVQLACDYQPEVIVHLAAQASVARSIADPELTRSVNVDGTRRVAEAALACGAARVVFASTAAVYGNPDPALLPLPETTAVSPLSPYGATKAEAELLLADMLRNANAERARSGGGGDGVDFAIARFANVYGPRQDALGEGGVVARFCAALAAGKQPVIYSDGRQTRDFIYVGDVVSGLVSMIGGDIAFAQEAGTAAAGIYHLSTGQPISIEQIARALQRISGVFVDFRYEPERAGDIHDSALSPTKSLEVFEWQAAIDLEMGLNKTWIWYAQSQANVM